MPSIFTRNDSLPRVIDTSTGAVPGITLSEDLISGLVGNPVEAVEHALFYLLILNIC